MRRVSIVFAVFLSVEVFTLIGMVIFIFLTVNELSEIVRILSSLLFSFGSLLLTTGLVYHHFWLHPELSIMSVVIDPLDGGNNLIAAGEFRSPVFAKSGHARYGRGIDNVKPKEKHGFKIVECDSTRPQLHKIRVSTDVTNIGGGAMFLHEYIVRELSPTERLIGTYVFRKLLPNQRRETADFVYPLESESHLLSGDYEFEITMIASTTKKSRRVKVSVSNDRRTIKWQEYDC